MLLNERIGWFAALVLFGFLGGYGCDSSATDVDEQNGEDNTPAIDGIELSLVAGGFSTPVHLSAPAGESRLFVVEKPGRIRVIDDGQVLTTPFLDISSLVSNGGEQGLLSLAFHPGYATNGYFYVYYTDIGGATRVVRYSVSSSPNVADASSAKLILQLDQPAANHNGGLITFGPDGMLYIGLGDGGGANDQYGNGQNLATLLGSLLRIDVDGGDPYAIPPDNPFVSDVDTRDEIWAYGLRNPWRYSFDEDQAALYIADVGQNTWEEVNVESAAVGGLNYGWNVMEGNGCFSAGDCSSVGMVLPVLQYGTGVEGCAVVGGFVYRGSAITGLAGTYFYSDNCTGWIRSFKLQFGQAARQREWELGDIGRVLSFGEDGAKELYVLSANGNVYRFVPTP
jgi:glucose/arabinose dehydrogenase